MKSANKNSLLLILTAISLFIAFSRIAFSIPPIPTEFYGSATHYDLNSTPLPSGTLVEIYAGNLTCGTFSVQNQGYYGALSCIGDDNYTSETEGAQYGQNIIFTINNETAQVFGDTVWYYGEYHMVNITPVPRCGNGRCELTESCIVCAEDCGLCPTNVSGNVTGPIPPGGGASGGGGGGGGSSGGGGGGGSGGGSGFVGGQNISIPVCQEDWFCTDWKPDICPVEEIYTRECNDKNNCNTEHQKPALNESCIYLGTCFDILKNQDETDTDCGGQKCEPCDLNKKCIFDLDCKSGFCDPLENICKEPTCTDGFKNQDEEGIDCGGPCPLCERPTLEKPGTITRFLAKGCGPFPWLFVLISSLASLLMYIIGKAYIAKVKDSKEYKKLKKIDRMIRLYDLSRDLNAFVLIIILLEIAIALYLYYLCEVGVWIFLMLLFIAPLIAAVIIKSYVYDEKRKIRRVKKLISRHEEEIRKLIKIERDEIAKEEKAAFDRLTNEVDYKKLQPSLALALKDIRYMLEERLGTRDDEPIELENTLSQTIAQIDTYKEEMAKDEKIKSLYNQLRFIEKINRDILNQYKKVLEDQEMEMELLKEDGASDNSSEDISNDGPDSAQSKEITKPETKSAAETSDDDAPDNEDEKSEIKDEKKEEVLIAEIKQ